MTDPTSPSTPTDPVDERRPYSWLDAIAQVRPGAYAQILGVSETDQARIASLRRDHPMGKSFLIQESLGLPSNARDDVNSLALVALRRSGVVFVMSDHLDEYIAQYPDATQVIEFDLNGTTFVVMRRADLQVPDYDQFPGYAAERITDTGIADAIKANRILARQPIGDIPVTGTTPTPEEGEES